MLQKVIVSSAGALSRLVIDLSHSHVDCVRVARSLYALSFAGTDLGIPLFRACFSYLLEDQGNDGGWTDIEETSWSSAVMYRIAGTDDASFRAAVGWLIKERKPTGGWGRHGRDRARIPITGLIAALLPDILADEDVTWLISEWERDFQGLVQLSYKAGFFLLAAPKNDANGLASQTLEHLAEWQNGDGGFGPWKNHPIGSDPWSTGVVLWGLSRWVHLVDKSVIHRALAWLEGTQLPSGYWPYHYLDDGTSLALIGAVAAMKALASAE